MEISATAARLCAIVANIANTFFLRTIPE